MSLLLTVVLAVVLWSAIGVLQRRLNAIEARLSSMAAVEAALARLTARVRALEGGSAPVPAAEEAQPPEEATGSEPVMAPATEAASPRPAGVPTPAVAPDVLVPVAAASATVPVVTPVAAEPLPDDASSSASDPAPAPVRASGPEPETWEVVVGTSWLNKIGVLVLVMGLALLLGYSMTNIGPAGRVVIGFVLSAALAGAGVVLERRTESRNYGYGLIAGGWAGVYVTAFAMRAIPAARVLETDAAGLAVLLAVAAAMVAHSLRYRSETVTALAYVAAYIPLAVTPLTTYSLIASVPLVVSLLFVAQRFGWSSIAALGLASTYGIFALRGSVLPGTPPDATSLAPYMVLAVYWLAFEAADVLGLRSSTRTEAGPRLPLFAMNAVGSLGAALMLANRAGEGAMVTVLVAAAGAYLGGALLRARLVSPSDDVPGQSSAFTSAHASLALSAAMVAWAIDIRTAGAQQAFALLLETELLIAAGLTLRDRQIRRVGSAMAVLVTAHVLSLILALRAVDVLWPWTMAAWTPVAAAVAATWYANREWIRARAETPDLVERLLPWTALLMIGAIIGHDLDFAYQGLAGLVCALVLLEAGVRVAPAYRAQSYLALAAGAAAVVAAFGPESSRPSVAVVWRAMPLAIVCAYAYAWRIRQATREMDLVVRLAAGLAASAGTMLLTIFEWRVLPPDFVGMAWAATALGLIVIGVRRQVVGVRWQAYALFALAVTHVSQWSLGEIALAERAGVTAVAAPLVALAVYGAAYVGAWIARTRSVAAEDAPQATVQLERLATYALPLITTLHLISFESVWLGTRFVSAAWTLTGVALLAAGLLWRAVDLRLQAYGVFALTALVTLFFILVPPDAASVVSTTVAVAALYASGLGFRHWIREAGLEAVDWVRGLDGAARLMLLTAATVLLATLVGVEARPALVTMGWGLQGTALLFTGFVARERALRLAGLVMLFVCILKLFLYDLRELEALARILSFVVLGLVLLGVSWTYTRYKEQIRKLF
jgi:hypothetical protein